MAELEGGLDDFRPITLLEFLAATAKTGMLRVAGHQRTVTVWVAEGVAIAAESTGPDTDLLDQLVDLLRTPAGTFKFTEGDLARDPDSAPADQPGQPQTDLLPRAVRRLREWESLADAVPSLSLLVKLLPAPNEEVTLSSAAWSVSVAVSSGQTSVAAVAKHLKWSAFKTCQAVRELVDAGRATLTPPPKRRRRSLANRVDAPVTSPGAWHAAKRPLWPGTGSTERDRFAEAWSSED
jgi:hypothetical protein